MSLRTEIMNAEWAVDFCAVQQACGGTYKTHSGKLSHLINAVPVPVHPNPSNPLVQITLASGVREGLVCGEAWLCSASGRW